MFILPSKSFQHRVNHTSSASENNDFLDSILIFVSWEFLSTFFFRCNQIRVLRKPKQYILSPSAGKEPSSIFPIKLNLRYFINMRTYTHVAISSYIPYHWNFLLYTVLQKAQDRQNTSSPHSLLFSLGVVFPLFSLQLEHRL